MNYKLWIMNVWNGKSIVYLSICLFFNRKVRKSFTNSANLNNYKLWVISYESVELSFHYLSFFNLWKLVKSVFNFVTKKRGRSHEQPLLVCKKQVLCLFNFFVIYILNIVTLSFLWLRFSLLTLFSLSVHSFCSYFPSCIDIV